MGTRIEAIGIATPATSLDNDTLAARFPGWTAEKIEKKLGIRSRYVLAPGETASDIAVQAIEALFASADLSRKDVDFLIYCTQSPDYLLPTTACIIQDRAGLPNAMGAIDINQGCSGYVYGLAQAHALLTAKLARKILLVTSDAYSTLVGENDASVRTIFGDAATATLLVADDGSTNRIGAFAFGTDGSGKDALIVHNSGARTTGDGKRVPLFMNGPAVLSFTLREVPPMVEQSLALAQTTMESIDFFVFHQANAFILSQLQRKMKIPDEKMVIDFSDVGNTVSSTIPIALSRQINNGRLARGQTGMLVGFGVGLSWASCVLTL